MKKWIYLVCGMDLLTQRYIKGDHEALSGLFTAMQASLRLVAYRYCRDAETSKDIVQEVFEKLTGLDLETRNAWFGNEKGNLSAWLYVAVKHKAMDHAKVMSNRGKIMDSVRYVSTDRLENGVNDDLYREGLSRMLDQLQPRQKEVMCMHINGYRNEEIAETLRITYNTVKNNIYEGRQRLRKLWRTFME